MSFAGALTVIETHLTAAGAAISPAITDIGRGERIGLSRRIDYWYEGDGPSGKLGAARTLGDEMVGERVAIRVVLPVTDRSVKLATDIDAEVQSIKTEIKKRLIGDSQLGSNIVDLSVGTAEAGWSGEGGAWARTLEIDLVLDFVDVLVIAP